MKFKRYRFVGLLIFMLSAFFASANKIFVNDNYLVGDIYTTKVGSDANSGIYTSPKLTLTGAMAIAVNGDTIYVDSGFYNSKNHTINKQLTIIGAGDGNTIFSGSSGFTFANITVSNVRFKKCKFTNYYGFSAGVVFLINSGL